MIGSAETGYNNFVIEPTNGNVGIGTTNPNAKLVVDGEINHGGDNWVKVPGHGFSVMKYEYDTVAPFDDGGAPRASINQATARSNCAALGAHLVTLEEATIIARMIEGNPANWVDNSGTKVLKRGNNGLTTITDAEYNGGDPDTGTGAQAPARLYLSGTESQYEIVHFSGNVWEWINEISTKNSTPLNTTTGSGWQEFTAAGNEFELANYGSNRKTLTSTNGIGQVYGGTSHADPVAGLARGGTWHDGAYAGVFTLYLGAAPSLTVTNLGFRCAR